MKKFMEKNVITHNLMSFSGFKSLLIFSMLTQSPKSYNDIKTALENNEYLRETISVDAIRIYINSLKVAGCEVKTIKEGRNTKYYIDSNPFELKISDEQVESMVKVVKAISKSIEISDFLALYQFFDKLSPYIKNEDLKMKLKYVSPVGNIKPDLIYNLMEYADKKIKISILYFSKISGLEKIDIIPDKLYIKNGKMYVSGHSEKYNNYASFLVSDIREITSVSLNSSNTENNIYIVQYEYFKNDNEFKPQNNETILNETNDKLVVEISSPDKFMITQRILSLTNKCRVISPKEYKQEMIECLKQMKENYVE